jgi:hypothetical protein
MAQNRSNFFKCYEKSTKNLLRHTQEINFISPQKNFLLKSFFIFINYN